MKFGILMFNIVLCVVAFLVVHIEQWQILILFQLLGNYLLIGRLARNKVSAGLLFLSLMTLFHFGRLFVSDSAFSMPFGAEALKGALLLSFLCISFLSVGYAFSTKNELVSKSDYLVSINDKTLSQIRKVSIYIIALTFIPLIIIDFLQIQYTLENGYGGLYTYMGQNLFIKYFGMFTTFTRPAILLLILTYKNSPKKALRVLIAFCAYSLLTMLSGARAEPMIFMLSALLIYLKGVKSLSERSVFFLVLFFVATIYVIPFLSSFRVESHEVGEVMSNVAKDSNQIESILDEFGGTVVSVIYSMVFTSHFNYGLTYLCGLVTISPKLPESLLPLLSTQLTYTNSFPESYQAFLGGSCIGEAYYNFGWLSPLLFIIIGNMLAKVDYYLSNFNRRNVMGILISITVLPYLFLWVRGFYCTMIFPVVWVPLLYRFFLKRTK